MSQPYSPGGFSLLPPVVKNLLIINGLFFLATLTFGMETGNTNALIRYLGLHYPESDFFKPYQLVSYMFLHGGISHIVMNMLALWMFGYLLENVWGPKRFLTYYMVTGIGAALIQMIVTWIEIQPAKEALDAAIASGDLYGATEIEAYLRSRIDVPTVGASGAVYGILLAFGMMFPNMMVFIYFLFPIKAKWLVILYGALELFAGLSNPGSNVAHFAHLGGMIFGFFLILYWRKKAKPYL